MKKNIAILSLFISLFCQATNYYVKKGGSDGAAGTSPETAWATITKVNTFFNSLNPGDAVLFNRGDIFYGSITIGKSGTVAASITIGAYGTGPKPIITGFTNITSWTNLGGNIWEANKISNSVSYENMVLVNGVNIAMGRYPNEGYLTYQSHSGKTSITTNALSGNWTGAELVYFISTYTIGRNIITSQSGGKLTFNSNPVDADVQFDNQGFFIQNDQRVLDRQNEWCYTTANRLRMYSIGSPPTTQLSTIESLVSITYQNYISINNISFTGSNTSGINIVGSKNISIVACDFNYSGKNAINGPYGGNADHITISQCSFNNTNNCAITLSGDFPNANISDNKIYNTGILPGMISNGGAASEAIYAQGAGTLIANNFIEDIGYNAISFFGNNSIVKNNFINKFCLVLKDGGGIYTYNGWPNTVQTGMKILDNTILNGDDTGIYLDDRSNGVEIYNNSIANCARAIYLHNNFNVNVHDNTGYNCSETGLLFDNFNGIATTDVSITDNIFIAKEKQQKAAWFSFITNVPSGLFLDRNVYARPIDDNATILTHIGSVYSNKTLIEWKALSGKDVNSKNSPNKITDINDLRFEYNATNTNKTIQLDGIYVSINKPAITNPLTLAPYTSEVLIKIGDIVVTPPPVVYYNSVQSKIFTRNDCPAGYTPGSISFTVAEGTFSASTQAAADKLAIDELNNNGQNIANKNGICTPAVKKIVKVIVYYSDGTQSELQ